MDYDQLVEADAILRGWLAEYHDAIRSWGDRWYDHPQWCAYFYLSCELAIYTGEWLGQHGEDMTPLARWYYIARIDGAYLVG